MSTNNAIQAAPGRRQETITDDLGELPSCTDHAHLRWLQRGGASSIALSEAWLDGFHVGGVSRGGTARLHPPTETLLVETDGHIVTVLRAAYTPYTDDHLVVCDDCDLKYQPTKDDRYCPWCGSDTDSEDGSTQPGDVDSAQID